MTTPPPTQITSRHGLAFAVASLSEGFKMRGGKRATAFQKNSENSPGPRCSTQDPNLEGHKAHLGFKQKIAEPMRTRIYIILTICRVLRPSLLLPWRRNRGTKSPHVGWANHLFHKSGPLGLHPSCFLETTFYQVSLDARNTASHRSELNFKGYRKNSIETREGRKDLKTPKKKSVSEATGALLPVLH